MKRTVKEFKGKDGKVKSVVLEDGTELQADVVVIGFGITPASGFLKDANKVQLLADGAISCNEYL